MWLLHRLEPAPRAAEPLPWLCKCPAILAMPPADAYCPASLRGVVHTNSGTHPVAPVLARAVARGWEMVFLVWNGLLPFPSLCPGRRVYKEMASEIM